MFLFGIKILQMLKNVLIFTHVWTDRQGSSQTGTTVGRYTI